MEARPSVVPAPNHSPPGGKKGRRFTMSLGPLAHLGAVVH